MCVTIFDGFWYCSKYPCQQEGLFLFLKPSNTLKKLGFKIFCIVCSLILSVLHSINCSKNLEMIMLTLQGESVYFKFT